MNRNYLESFEQNGYVVIDNLIEKSLIDQLMISSDKVATMARDGNWVILFIFLLSII